MEIPVRAHVRCTDGPAGEATHVIVHPATRKVTRLVVKETRSPHVERVVPFKLVLDANASEIHLQCSRQELSKMQPFVRTEFVGTTWAYDESAPSAVKKVKRLNIAEDELPMDTGTQVRAIDGKAGRIDELMVDPASASITHLVLREGPIWAPKAVVVPVTEVERLGDKAVYLRTNRASIEALPATPVPRK
jgi:sporulation protein YlmC with PRC-barrel domain